MFWPCETRTSTCRNFATISSGLYRFLVIAVLLDVKDIPQVGPLLWGRITCSRCDEYHKLSKKFFNATIGPLWATEQIANHLPPARVIPNREVRVANGAAQPEAWYRV